jgi:MYXO-CTERM domain-containing protein
MSAEPPVDELDDDREAEEEWLPEVGSVFTPRQIIGGFVLLAALIALLLRRRRRGDDEAL